MQNTILNKHITHDTPNAITFENTSLRVFNPTFQKCLEKVNHTTRALRYMGYRIIWQRLPPLYPHGPIIKIDRGKQQSFRPLLDQANSHRWCHQQGRLYGFTYFMETTITWEESGNEDES